MFDVLVLGVLGLSTAFAALRGASRELATLIALAAAAFMGLLLVEPILDAVGQAGSFFATVFVAVAVVAIFFLFFHLLSYFALRRAPIEGRAALIDRVSGGVLGFGRGLVLVGLGYLAYGYYLDEARQPESVKSAFTRPVAAAMAGWFEGFTPEDAYIENEKISVSEPEEDASVLGYQRNDRNGLEQVLTTVTTTDELAAEEIAPSVINPVETEEDAFDESVLDFLTEDNPQ